MGAFLNEGIQLVAHGSSREAPVDAVQQPQFFVALDQRQRLLIEDLQTAAQRLFVVVFSLNQILPSNLKRAHRLIRRRTV